eukprot:1839872-Pyramimonas_sp.AAC.1
METEKDFRGHPIRSDGAQHSKDGCKQSPGAPPNKLLIKSLVCHTLQMTMQRVRWCHAEYPLHRGMERRKHRSHS